MFVLHLTEREIADLIDRIKESDDGELRDMSARWELECFGEEELVFEG